MGVPAQKPEGLPIPEGRPTKPRWHGACRVAGLIDTLDDRLDQSTQAARPSHVTQAMAMAVASGSQPRVTKHPSLLSVSWRGGRLKGA
jgi:hypothetical protein